MHARREDGGDDFGADIVQRLGEDAYRLSGEGAIALTELGDVDACSELSIGQYGEAAFGRPTVLACGRGLIG